MFSIHVPYCKLISLASDEEECSAPIYGKSSFWKLYTKPRSSNLSDWFTHCEAAACALDFLGGIYSREKEMQPKESTRWQLFNCLHQGDHQHRDTKSPSYPKLVVWQGSWRPTLLIPMACVSPLGPKNPCDAWISNQNLATLQDTWLPEWTDDPKFACQRWANNSSWGALRKGQKETELNEPCQAKQGYILKMWCSLCFTM